MADDQASNGVRYAVHGTRLRPRARRSERRRRRTGARSSARALVVGAVVFAVWTAGIEARLVYLQVFSTTRPDGARRPPAAAHDRRRRPSAARSSIATAACSPTASTPTSIFADPDRDRRPGQASPQRCARALDDCDARERAGDRRAPAKRSAPVRLPARARCRPTKRSASRALELEGHRLHQGEPPLLPEAGAGGARARLRRARQHRAGRPRVDLRRADPRPRRQGAGPDRREAARARQPRRAPAHGRRVARADHRPVPAAHRRARAARRRRGEPRRRRHGDHHGSARRARSSRWPTAPTFNPERLRRAPDGRTAATARSRTSTSRARRSRSSPPRRRSKNGVITPERLDRLRAGLHHASAAAPIDDVHRYGVLSFTDVIVKSSNVGAIKVGFSLGPERLERYVAPVRLRPAARRPTSAARTRASSGIRRSSTTARSRRCRWAIRSA